VGGPGLNVYRHPLSLYRQALGEIGVVRESLQRPPTKSGRPVYFLLIEDEYGLLQCTIFESAYRRHGHMLHHAGAFLV